MYSENKSFISTLSDILYFLECTSDNKNLEGDLAADFVFKENFNHKTRTYLLRRTKIYYNMYKYFLYY